MGNFCICPTGSHHPPTSVEIDEFAELCRLEKKDFRAESARLWQRMCGSMHDFEAVTRQAVRDEVKERLERVNRDVAGGQAKRKHRGPEPVVESDSELDSEDESDELGEVFHLFFACILSVIQWNAVCACRSFCRCLQHAPRGAFRGPGVHGADAKLLVLQKQLLHVRSVSNGNCFQIANSFVDLF